MPYPMKRFAALFAGAIVLCLGFTFLIGGLLWFHDPLCYRNTVYSERYSEKAFRRISVGTARAAVIETLGAPLSSRSVRSPTWAIADGAVRNRYQKEGEVPLEHLMFSQPKDSFHDFHWVSATIGPDGTVIASSSYITD